MATDATGVPTSLGIPKYNTSVDAPSGLGFNAAMDSIDTLLAARVTKAAYTTAGDILVASGAATPARLGVGSAGQVLTVSGGLPVWGSGGARYKKVTPKVNANSVANVDMLNGEITLAANDLSATGVLRLTAEGTMLQNSGAGTGSLRWLVQLGGVTIIDSGALAGSWASNAQILPWKVVVDIVAQNATNSQYVQMTIDGIEVATGSTAILYAVGSGIYNADAAVGGYHRTRGQGYNTSAIDMTASKTLALIVNNPVANAAMNTTLNGATVEIL